MRTNTLIILSILALTLPSTIFPKVTFRGQQPAIIYEEDKHLVGLEHAFDLSQIAYPAKVTVKGGEQGLTNGKGYTYQDPYFQKEYHYPERQNLNFVKFLDNQTIAMVHDNHQVTIQSIELDGTSVSGRYWTKSFNLHGADVICEDIVLNQDRDVAYIGCQDKSSTELQPGAIWLYQVDMQTQETEKVLITDEQKDGWRIKHRLQLGLFRVPHPSANAEEQFLFLWDQGISIHSKTDSNRKFIYFESIDAGVAVFGGLVEADGAFTALYDFVNYRDKIYITSRLKNNTEYISLLECEFRRGEEVLPCDGAHVQTEVKHGLVGFFNTGQFFTFDRDKAEASVYDPNGEIGEPGFLQNPVYTDTNLPMIEDENQWVRRYEGNEEHSIIHWSRTGGFDAGVVVISRRESLRTSFLEKDTSGAILGNLYLSVQGNLLSIHRLGYPFYYAEGDRDLVPGENLVHITLEDKESTASGVLNITVLSNVWVPIEIGHNLPYMDAYEGASFEVPFGLFEITSGNGIHFDLEFDNDLLQPFVLNEYSIDVVTQPVTPQRSKFREFNIMRGHILAQDYGARMYYYTCSSDEPREILCRKEFDIIIDDDSEHLQDTIFSHHGVVFSWTKSTKHTTAYFFSKSQGFNRFRIEGVAGGAVMTHNGQGDLLAIFAMKDRVLVYMLNPNDHSEWDLIHTLHARNVRSEFFCPVEVKTDVFEPTHFHVLSYCPQQKDQRIIKLSYQDSSLVTIEGSVGIILETVAPNFCPMGSEYIIWSQGKTDSIYAVNEVQDIAVYQIPTDPKTGFRLRNINSIQCNSDIGQFTVISDGSASGTKDISVFWGNRQVKGHLRMEHHVTDVVASRVESFSAFHGIAHVLYDKDGDISLLGTSTMGPLLRATVLYSDKLKNDTEVTMSIKTQSFLRFNTVTHPVVVRKPYTNLSVEVVGKPDDIVGAYDLEDFISIRGPVFHANLLGTHEMQLKERASLEARISTADSPEFQFTFDHFRAYGTYAIGIEDDEFSTTSIVGFIADNRFNSVYYSNRVVSFDFAVWDFSKFFMVLSTLDHSGSRAYLEALVWDSATKQRVLVHDEDFLSLCDSIKIAPMKGDDYLVFCHEVHTETLDVVRARISSTSIKFESLYSLSTVYTWDIATQEESIYIYTSEVDSSVLRGTKVSRENGAFTNILPSTAGERNYHLGGIAAGAHNSTHNMIAIVTLGTRILDCVAPIDSESVDLDCLSLDKYKDYDGLRVEIDKDYIIHYATTTVSSKDTAALLWKRRAPETMGQLFYAVDLSKYNAGRAPAFGDLLARREAKNLGHAMKMAQSKGTGVNSRLGISKDDNGVTLLSVPTHMSKEPVHVYTIGDFEVIIPLDAEIEFDKVYLDLEGESSEPFTLEKVFKRESGTVDRFTWWPFALIVAVLLIIALSWFYYTKASFEEERETIADSDGNYMSLGKTTIAKKTELQEEDLDEEED